MHSDQTQAMPPPLENSEGNLNQKQNATPAVRTVSAEAARKLSEAARARNQACKTGDVIGRLTLEKSFYPADKNTKHWRCRCACGNLHVTTDGCLRSGDTKSCGCLHKEQLIERNLRHGQTVNKTQTPEYTAWIGMKVRTNPLNNFQDIKNHAARGIRICAGWNSSFPSFLHDMGNRPSQDHSIDRINNDGHYSCGHCEECLREGWTPNCRWATRKVQNNNRRSNISVEINGATKTINEWSDYYMIGPSSIYKRIRKGMTASEAITSPKTSRNRTQRRCH